MNRLEALPQKNVGKAEHIMEINHAHINNVLSGLSDMLKEDDMNIPQNREAALLLIKDVALCVEEFSLAHKAQLAGGFTNQDEQKLDGLVAEKAGVLNGLQTLPQQNWVDRVASELSPTRFLG